LMIFKIPQIISYMSSVTTLEPGDTVLTGTPAGVGPVRHGDVIDAGIDQQGKTIVKIQFSAVKSELPIPKL
jgi:2-keto-4-pentenoate hydratase/2-oxohepta-3-ene-1,7-dioic acid hydratase in catechol pathway